MSLHLELKAQIEARYGAQLPAGVALKQDALLLQFDNGLVMELRFASAQEYVLGWLWGDAELRIDTAPLHPGLNSYPNHLHDEEGRVREDPLTRPGAAPWDNVCRLIDAVLADPLLSS
jgi:hypothetical protein